MENQPFLHTLLIEPGHCVVDIMPRGSPVHLAPRAVTWDRSYTETSIEGKAIVPGPSDEYVL